MKLILILPSLLIAIPLALFCVGILTVAILIRAGQELVKWLTGTSDVIEYNERVEKEWAGVGVICKN